MRRVLIKIVAIASALTAVFVTRVEADALTDFYKKSPLSIYVSSAPGGGYDDDARLLSRHLGHHIPGSPNLIVKNMPGAGGSVAANYVYNVAPKDGTTILMPQNTLTIDQFTSSSDVKFDMRNFQWLGSMNVNQSVCIFAKAVGKLSGPDFLSRKLVVGASGGVTASPSLIPKLLNQLGGTQFEVINGYEGTNVLVLAMERGEVQGLCGIGWDSVKAQIGTRIKSGDVEVGLDVGSEPDRELKRAGVPFMLDLIPNGKAKDVLMLIMSVQQYGRPFAMPPGTPPDRLAAIRTAFDETMKDPGFREEAGRLNIQVQPITADQVIQYINVPFSASKDIRDRALSELSKAGWGISP